LGRQKLLKLGRVKVIAVLILPLVMENDNGLIWSLLRHKGNVTVILVTMPDEEAAFMVAFAVPQFEGIEVKDNVIPVRGLTFPCPLVINGVFVTATDNTVTIADAMHTPERARTTSFPTFLEESGISFGLEGNNASSTSDSLKQFVDGHS
jgi:hypothetical protein